MRVLFRWYIRCFTWCQNCRDTISDRDLVAGLRNHLSEHAGRRCFDLDCRFVGLNLHERFALGDRLPFGFEPLEQLAGLLRHAEGGHDYVGRQVSLGSRVQMFKVQFVNPSLALAPQDY